MSFSLSLSFPSLSAIVFPSCNLHGISKSISEKNFPQIILFLLLFVHANKFNDYTTKDETDFPSVVVRRKAKSDSQLQQQMVLTVQKKNINNKLWVVGRSLKNV